MAAFKALLRMVGFLVYGVFAAADKLVFGDALAAWAAPLFLATVVATLLWGLAIVWQGRTTSSQNRLSTMLLAHGFAWLGVQSMFVMNSSMCVTSWCLLQARQCLPMGYTTLRTPPRPLLLPTPRGAFSPWAFCC